MGKQQGSEKRIGVAFLLNLSFTIIEIIGAFLTNSMAILSDAIHDAGDTLSLGFSYFFEMKSKKGPDKEYTYGYERFSLLGALISSFILFGASIFIFTEAIPRLFNPEPVNALGMILLSILGIFFNGLAVLRLKGGSSHHEKIVSWHLLEDLLGWGAILITSIILFFVEWYFLDTLLSILITIYIVIHVGRNLRRVIQILLQKAPEQVDVQKITRDIAKIEGVRRAYHIHIWSLEGSKTMLTMHVVLDNTLQISDIMKIKNDVKAYLKEASIEHSTIECDFRIDDEVK